MCSEELSVSITFLAFLGSPSLLIRVLKPVLHVKGTAPCVAKYIQQKTRCHTLLETVSRFSIYKQKQDLFILHITYF